MARSITTRLIVLLTLCAATILGLAIWLDYRLSRDEILQRLRHDSQQTVNGVITDMENWLDGVEGSTLFLARILEQRDYSQPGLQQMLKDIVQNNEDIFGATIALNPALVEDPLGFAPYYYHHDGILSYSDLASERNNYSDQPWFTDTVDAGKPVWVEPYFDEGGGEVLMTTFAVPVYRFDDAGERLLYAVVTADVSLQELHNYLKRLRLGDSGYSILLSRQGVVLSGRDSSDVMHHYSEVQDQALDLAVWQEMFRQALGGNILTRELECPNIRGRCMIRLGALQSTGWPVGVVYAQREIIAPLREFQVKTAITGALTLLLMALAVYFVIHRLTRPLIALSRASDDMARGVLDTPLPAARGEDEVARLIRSFHSMNRDLKSYIADLEAVTASRSRLQGELAAAREIQMSMLPGGGEAYCQGRGFELWAKVRPAKSVGGDLYTYYRGDNKLFLAVGDVSDKGVPAALFMARAISLIQQLAGTDTEPARALGLINNALEQGNDNCMFVTLFLAVLDLETLELCFASAGHTPPALLRNGSVTAMERESGPALGLAPDLEFMQHQLPLRDGDRLAIYTDGIDEAFSDTGEMYGTERFEQQLAATCGSSVSEAGASLFAAVDAFAGQIAQSDDITLLLLQLAPQDAPLRRSFSRGPGLATRVQDWLQQYLQGRPAAAGVTMDVILVAEEIVSNIDKYAGLGEDDAIEVSVAVDGAKLVLEVADDGEPFDPLRQARRPPLGAEIDSAEIGGLGVHLITQLTDRQGYRRESGRNILRVEKDLSGDTNNNEA